MKQIDAIVKEALEKTKGDRERAYQAVLKQHRPNLLNGDPIHDYLVQSGLRQEFRSHSHHIRMDLEGHDAEAMGASYNRGAENGRRLLAAFEATWYDFPLPGGSVILGDATKAQVKDARDYYLGQSAAYGSLGQWMEAILSRMRDAKQPVRKQVDLVKLSALRQKAVGEDSEAA